MSEITKEQIQRLERVGIAIIDSISDEFNTIKLKSDDNKKSINALYSEFGKMLGNINEEEAESEN